MSKVGIIVIGNEIVNGFTSDTNSVYINKKLSQYKNIQIYKIIQVSDIINDINDALDYLLNKSIDYIFLTGGLGPTHDDITKQALRDYFKSDIILKNKYYEKLLSFYKKKGIKNTDHLKSQAEILSNSMPIPNRYGTALGLYIEHANSKIFVLPGVPKEVIGMVEFEIIPNYIDKNFDKVQNYITILTSGIYESQLSSLLHDLIKDNKEIFNVAFLPSYNGVKIRISYNGINKKLDLNDFKEEILENINKYVYGYNDDLLEEVIVNKLIGRSLTLSLAESCTGGYISKKITDIPGSSKVYMGGIIAYNNIIKREYLQVPDEILKKYGAVSKEVALQMAESIRNNFKTDIGLAVTGISGPGGGTNKKPVGLVYIAIVFKDKKIVKEFNLTSQRDSHRELTCHISLHIIRSVLSDI